MLPSPPSSHLPSPRPTSGTDPQGGPSPVPDPTPLPDRTAGPAPTDEPTEEPTAQPTPRPTREPAGPPHATDAPATRGPGTDTVEPTAPASHGPEAVTRARGRVRVTTDALGVAAAPGVVPSAGPSPVASSGPSEVVAGLRSLVHTILDALLVLFAVAVEADPGDPGDQAGPADPGPTLGPIPRALGPRLPAAPPRLGLVGRMTNGIDLSLWNERVPYRALRDAGARFAVVKATQGTTIVDPAFREHVASARREGMDVGAYHFYDYRVGGRAQADHFVDALVAAGALRRSLPLVVDVECFGPFGAADRTWVRAELRAFVGRVYQRTGHLPMVYTSWYMWRQVTGGDPSFGRLPLWVACWRCSRPLLPTGWDDWDLWQVGSVVTGPDGRRVGSDVFDGTPAELRGLVRDRRP